MEAQLSAINTLGNINTVAGMVLGYDAYLLELNIPFQINGNFIEVYGKRSTSGWEINISVIRPQTSIILKAILPWLESLKIPFILPKDNVIHTQLLEGGFGFELLGKIIRIYPRNNTEANAIGLELVIRTKQYSGPNIPAASFIGGCIYVAYAPAENEDYPQSSKAATWPFNPIPIPKDVSSPKWINKRFLIIQKLKRDIKGDVYQCIHFRKLLKFDTCVVKQGNFNQCADEHGRTVADRLKWQFEQLRRFEGEIALPKAYDYFLFEQNAYLVMQDIKGSNLFDMATSIQQGVCWHAMPKVDRRTILKLLLQVVDIIQKFHDFDIVHRDVNPGNFIVDLNEQVIAIDTELAYDKLSGLPNPPFTLGTPGYISPQQYRLSIPQVADDVYGVCALIIRILTGISPGKFAGPGQRQFNNVFYFIGSNSLATALCCGVDPDENGRPALSTVKHLLEVQDALLLTDSLGDEMQVAEIPSKALSEIINASLRQFADKDLQNIEGYWMAKADEGSVNYANEFKRYGVNVGFGNGICGILFLVSLAEKLKYDTYNLIDAIDRNFRYVQNETTAFRLSPGFGLYYGNIGLAVALNELINAGFEEGTLLNHQKIYDGLQSQTFGLNLSSGIAGQGLAILRCSVNNQLPKFYNELHNITEQLITAQNRDGSWSLRKGQTQNKGVKLYGFSHGIAGIVYFLLCYAEKYENPKVRFSIVKGLNYLMRQRRANSGKLTWPISAINKNIDPWFEYGFTGVALTFIKAFTVFNDAIYKDTATQALSCHPVFITSNYFTVANGLAGLGEVYLEAYKAFGGVEWYQRATHIVNIFTRTYQTSKTGLYWLDGSSSIAAGDLMNGNAGITHFLMHYLNPKQLAFPFKIN